MNARIIMSVALSVILLSVIVSADFPVPTLLEFYESGDKEFQEVEISDFLVYFHQRVISNEKYTALVEANQIVYKFDKKTNELIEKKIDWRKDLPKKLPEIKVTKEQVESMVKGQVTSSNLMYIAGIVLLTPSTEVTELGFKVKR